MKKNFLKVITDGMSFSLLFFIVSLLPLTPLQYKFDGFAYFVCIPCALLTVIIYFLFMKGENSNKRILIYSIVFLIEVPIICSLIMVLYYTFPSIGYIFGIMKNEHGTGEGIGILMVMIEFLLLSLIPRFIIFLTSFNYQK